MIYLQLIFTIKTTYKSLDFWRIISFSILSLKIPAYILAPFCVKWMQSWLIILWLSVNTLTELPDMLPKMIEDNCNNSNRLQHINKDKSVFHISLLFVLNLIKKSKSIIITLFQIRYLISPQSYINLSLDTQKLKISNGLMQFVSFIIE